MRIFLTVFTLLLQCLSFSPAAVAAETVTLQLKWEHAFQFAGYYAAVEQGYYQQAGLNVQLKPADPGVNLIDEVVSGRAQYGVGMSGLLLDRKAGKPVVALAVIFQHSPLVLIASKKTAAQSIHDLSNKAVLIEPLAEELLAYLKREGVAMDGVKPMIHRFKSEDLISGKADAISAYLSNEPFQLDQAGFEYQIYTPRSAGIDFYGDNLFTSESEIKLHPDRVKAFRAASLRGWEYAMNHRDEMIRLIIKKYAPQHSTARFQFEAEQMASLMRTDLVAVGYMNPGRWRHIADTYAEIGMLPANFSLKGFIYEPDPKADLTWFYLMLAAAAGLFSIIAAIALYIHRINGRLASTLAEFKKTELRLKVFSTAIEQSPTPVLITGPDSVIQY
ncbi:MAG: ABC transporter substrate-binding protein, partial [Iodobacter sp.]